MEETTNIKKEKKRENDHRYYLENAERIKARCRTYYSENIEKGREQRKKWAAAHPEETKERRRRWYIANIEKVMDQNKKWCAENPEKLRAIKHNWIGAHLENHRDNEHIRRTRKRNGIYEKINSLEIYERDKWICQLCQENVDEILKYPNPMSATLDHVIPLVAGGSHTKDNVQLAHLGCNRKANGKGAKKAA